MHTNTNKNVAKKRTRTYPKRTLTYIKNYNINQILSPITNDTVPDVKNRRDVVEQLIQDNPRLSKLIEHTNEVFELGYEINIPQNNILKSPIAMFRANKGKGNRYFYNCDTGKYYIINVDGDETIIEKPPFRSTLFNVMDNVIDNVIDNDTDKVPYYAITHCDEKGTVYHIDQFDGNLAYYFGLKDTTPTFFQLPKRPISEKNEEYANNLTQYNEFITKNQDRTVINKYTKANKNIMAFSIYPNNNTSVRYFNIRTNQYFRLNGAKKACLANITEFKHPPFLPTRKSEDISAPSIQQPQPTSRSSLSMPSTSLSMYNYDLPAYQPIPGTSSDMLDLPQALPDLQPNPTLLSLDDIVDSLDKHITSSAILDSPAALLINLQQDRPLPVLSFTDDQEISNLLLDDVPDTSNNYPPAYQPSMPSTSSNMLDLSFDNYNDLLLNDAPGTLNYSLPAYQQCISNTLSYTSMPGTSNNYPHAYQPSMSVVVPQNLPLLMPSASNLNHNVPNVNPFAYQQW